MKQKYDDVCLSPEQFGIIVYSVGSTSETFQSYKVKYTLTVNDRSITQINQHSRNKMITCAGNCILEDDVFL